MLHNLYRGLAGRVRRARYVANMSDKRWAKAVEEQKAPLEIRAHQHSVLAGSLGAALWGAFRARKLQRKGLSVGVGTGEGAGEGQ